MPKERILFLASKSPRRQQILDFFNIKYQIIDNLLKEEVFNQTKSLRQSIREIAFQKAFFSKKDYQGLILGVDTVVVLNNHILGKPKDLKEAERFLHALSGQIHQVISGLCLYDTIQENFITRTETTYVNFRKLTKKQIQYYIHNFNVLDKAGSYAIQDEYIKDFISQIKGSRYNVIGLPIKTLIKLLQNYKLIVLKPK